MFQLLQENNLGPPKIPVPSPLPNNTILVTAPQYNLTYGPYTSCKTKFLVISRFYPNSKPFLVIVISCLSEANINFMLFYAISQNTLFERY